LEGEKRALSQQTVKGGKRERFPGEGVLGDSRGSFRGKIGQSFFVL